MKLNAPTSKFFLQISFVILVATVTFVYSQKIVFAYVLLPYKWATNTVKYDPHSLPSGWITIASESRQPWNDVTPSPFTFLRDDTSNNDLYWNNIDGNGGTQAYVIPTCTPSPCAAGGTVVRATMTIDSGDAWYTGSSCMVPSTQFDGRDVGTHEFGHMATLAHSTCPAGPTMCGASVRGSCARRSLENDDRNGLNAQYP